VTTTRISHKERTAISERRLFDEALSLIAEKGFGHTTAAEIGVRAGYSKEMVRARYGSKDAFLGTLLSDEFERRFLRADEHSEGLRRALAPHDSLRRQLAEDTKAVRAFIVLSFEAVTPIEGLAERMTEWLDRYERYLVDALERGREDGSVRADLDPAAEARRFLGTGIGHAFRWVVRPETFEFDAALKEMRADAVSAWEPVHNR
jgi:AcrR family transcriptional regulator